MQIRRHIPDHPLTPNPKLGFRVRGWSEICINYIPFILSRIALMPLRRSESALHDHILVSLSGHIRVSLSGFHSRRQQSKSPPKVPVKTIEAEEKKQKISC